MRILEWDQEEECLEALLLEEEMEEMEEEGEVVEAEEILEEAFQEEYLDDTVGKVRPPDIFTGDHHKSQAFIDSLWLLFTGDPTRFTSDNVKIATTLSYISGENVDYWVRNKIESAQYLGLGTWYDFVCDFTLVFAPLNEAENAILALEQLNLRSDSTIHEFNGKYNELIRKSQIFDAQARLSYYRNALPAWLRTKISTSYPVSKTIEQWIERATDIYEADAYDQAINRRRKGFGSFRRTPQKKVRRNQLEEAEEMEAEVNRLSKEEHLRHLEKELCFICHNPGHVAQNLVQSRPLLADND
ncbi:hypothetical protein GSI_06980 [Ganoderma sinense ZZ0214-1]|uniref:Retrotransposon gag domain-containing protein n=1 Tax=Ganoderma sinense ZZ0214-1 TaxID=1077348 RepID=A0A2G8SAN4_9APHY|nr:hypothetical protein GSI_06980 [Ganoderma sinense ZZ0214-1]